MPSFSSPSPPISTRLVDDPRPLPGAQAPLASTASTHKASPASITPTLPATRAGSSPPAAVKERAGSNPPSKAIDREVFDQILEFDEDDEGFSELMVNEYFVQAEKTFSDMETALGKKNLSELSSLGHFLKGSSAALGVFKVQLSCEHIQHYGHLKEGTNTITEAEAIVKITNTLARTRDEFAEAKRELELIYEKKKKETTSLTSTLSFF